MALLLHIETATRNCSVALSSGEKLLACEEIAEQGYSHAEKLHVFIQRLFDRTGHAISALDAVSVSRGPGSYTGLRIGVSAAKGLCYALGIPLIAVDTLKILANQSKITDGLIVPMLDARRMEVYSAVYSPGLETIQGVQAEIITPESFSAFSGKKLYFVGDANKKCKPLLEGEDRIFIDAVEFPSAKAMVDLAAAKYASAEFEDVAYFEPFYLKDFLVSPGKK